MQESNSFLDDFQQNQILVLHRNGFTQKFIADLLKVSQKTIWRHLHKQMPISDLHGEGNGNCKLTDKQVLEIRSIYVPFETTYKEIAEKYDVSISTIKSIILRQTWKHI